MTIWQANGESDARAAEKRSDTRTQTAPVFTDENSNPPASTFTNADFAAGTISATESTTQPAHIISSENRVLGFGKHKNKKIKNIPTSYLRWTAFNSSIYTAKQWAKEELMRRGIDAQGLLIPRDKLQDMVGKAVHLTFAGHGCQWILQSIDGDLVHLITPVTRKHLTARAEQCYYTNKNLPQQKEE